ncbi:MAG: crosslink repair DNA glycosylase YcaQ family protein [Leptospiraceae bacterium]
MKEKLKQIALHHQGLTDAASTGRKPNVAQVVKSLGYLQIDTISVVSRAHHHTLWNRIPEYRTEYLDKALKERRIFEFWYHAASYLPIEDYRFRIPLLLSVWPGAMKHFSAVSKKLEKHVLERIRAEGPLQSRDFDSARISSAWGNKKHSSQALEKLFFQGDLMISARNNMQKVYDLTERVLPSEIKTKPPTADEFCEFLVDSTLKAHGFTTMAQLTHLRKGKEIRSNLSKILEQRIEEGSVIKVEENGIPAVFALTKSLHSRKMARQEGVRILSPFDNLVIHRERLSQIFGFDYRIECYVPKEKRRYGYFCLPILHRGEIVGRADCKAHRRNRVFELINLYLETSNVNRQEFTTEFVTELKCFAEFNECDRIIISGAQPVSLQKMMIRELSRLGES